MEAEHGYAAEEPEILDRRPEALESLVANLVRGSLSPLTRQQVAGSARELLDAAWATASAREISEAIEALDEISDILRDGVDRYYAREMSRSIADVHERLEDARRAAELIANTEGSAALEIRSRQHQSVFASPLLDGPQERALGARAVTGDRGARNEMVEANTRLAWSIAQRWRSASSPALEMDDLFQEGCLGLVRAAEKFDPTRGFKFSTYATWWIRQAVTRALADKGRTIRIPVHVVDRLLKMAATERELRASLHRAPTPEEIGAHLHWSEQRLRETQGAELETLPLEDIEERDSIDRTSDLVEDKVEAASVHWAIGQAVEGLLPRERVIIDRRFGITSGKPATLDEIGQEFGLTRERIRQIETSVLKQLASTIMTL